MEQLETLKQIFQSGYISEAEYERRKTQIIDKLTNTSLDALASGLLSSSDVLMDGIGSKSEVAFESAAQNSSNNSNTLDNYAIQSTDCNMQIEDCSSFKGADIYSSAPSAAASSGKAERCEDDTNFNSTTYDNDATFVDSFQQKASASSLQERKQLAKSISRLDATSLQKLLQIIMNEAPHLVKNPNGKKDFSFDLNEFDDSMLLRTFEVVEELNCVNLQENEIPSKKRISEYETDSYNTLNNVTSNNSKILTNSGSFITPFKSRKIEDTPAAFSPVSDFKSESGEPSDIISLSKSQEDLFTSILSTPSVDLATDLSLYASPAITTQQDFSSYFNQLQSSPSVVDSNVDYSLELLDNSTSDVSMLNSISKEQEDDIIGIPVDAITNENDLIEDISDDRFTSDSLVLTPNDSNTSSSPITEVKGESKKIRIKIQVYRVEKNGTGNKPWCCDAPGCNKKFSDSSNLIKHLRVHTQEKPYDCPYCGKCFSHNSSLKEHMNIHTGAKPFICEICQQPFAQSANLKRHMRIHTGEKPFTCSECGKGFSQSTNLKSHEERVHKQKNSSVPQKVPNSLMPPSLNNT